MKKESDSNYPLTGKKQSEEHIKKRVEARKSNGGGWGEEMMATVHSARKGSVKYMLKALDITSKLNNINIIEEF